MTSTAANTDASERGAAGCQWRTVLVAGFAMACFAGVMLGLKPIPQPQDYHGFADARTWGAIPNAQNVLSNLPFLLVAIMGLRWLSRPGAACDPELRPAYLALFLGLGATAFGSAYYHWAPTSATLFWDRMPIAIGFMALFSAVIGERMGPRLGARLLAPLMLYAAASVLYWYAVDDLRPYLVAQFLPLLAIPLLMALYPARYTHAGSLLISLGCYVLAKLAEHADEHIYGLGHYISGHTLKHLLAALGAWFVMRMLLQRNRVADRR